MLTPPPDLGPEQISCSLSEHWGLEDCDVTYVPLGHGSHNWSIVASDRTRWFAKASRTGPDSDFGRATYQTAALLREAGLDFVLGPVRDRSGEARPQVSPEWELAVFPFIEGRNPNFNTGERAQVAEILGRLHAFATAPEIAIRWEPGWYQPELREILAGELDRQWNDGPYGEQARSLFVSSRAGIERLLEHSDRLVARLADSDDPPVITHGEPHGGNTMIDSSGKLYLIDCNALMVAPRERDLRILLHASHRRSRNLDNTEVIAAYRRTAGPIEPRPFAIELFRAEWHLIEICRYAQLFSGPHGRTSDVHARWETLNAYLPVAQNWPELESA
ncbi:MAG TPA: aminoglycoside phosphotransferase family protein [Mycobacteriales bacterium]|nr:aminoglycoside phosphotransferase family protein [Mycobacteriales bacterium]